MSLTTHEARQWQEIVERLSRPDPPTDDRVRGRRRPSRRCVLWACLAAVVLMGTLVVGVALQQQVLCAVGWCGVIAGTLWWAMVIDTHDDRTG